ncbi:restriction endonuclease subunit S [Catenibacterium mitsuokai]|uniref:restriction endonuclease subunit S n=1 Tax=Catenibacterium mitsuokai TaxID=100886 RepID=UPI002E7743AF|nr:restriction endonuclease subunit S [Catenibacterium tridentinum]
MTELKEICKVQCGFAFDSKKFTEDDSFSPLIRIRDVKRGFTQTYYTGEFSSEYIVHKGDLLVGMDGEFNIARWNSEDALLNQRVCRIIANSNINEEYLRFYLKRALKLIESKTSFVTVKHLSAKELNGLKLNLPCMEDQQCISKQLSILELVIGKNKKVLELFDELVKARFVEMFGDPNIEFKYSSVKFNDLVARMTKGPFGSDMKKDLFVPKGENTYKVYIQINAIQKNQSLGEYYISKEYFDRKVSRFELFPNDYIITCDGTLGKYLKLDENMEKGVISPSLLRLTLQNDKINDKYFENIWDFYMLGLMKKEARNACLVHLPSAKKIGEISIPVPPLELQYQFASFVEEIDKSRSRIQKSLEASQELFDSLMQEYFC